MARLLTCGYETGDVAEAGTTTNDANGVLGVVSATPTPRAGVYCLKASTANTTTNRAWKSYALGASKTEVWVRFAFYAHAWNTEVAIAKLIDAASGDQACVTYSGADGLLRARQGGTSGGTLLGAASSSLGQDSWHFIEWRHQMTNATTGTTEVWLDGNRVINFSGDNTATANVTVVSFSLGHLSLNNAVGVYSAFDDIAINDTAGTRNNGRPGDGRVVLLAPSGAGSSTVLTRGGTDTGANWSQASEIPPSMTQYVLSANAGDRDLYVTADLPVAVSAINVVEELLLVQNSDAGAGSIGPTIRSGGTTSELTAISVTNTATYVTGRWETDPNTSAAWSAAAVNALEIGATVR